MVGKRACRAWYAPVGVVSLSVLLAACGSSGTAKSSGSTATTGSTTTLPIVLGSGAASQLQNAYIAAVNQVRPSVVEISTSSGLGSGVVYDHVGDIVTNAHVVGSSQQFRVTLADGRTLDGSLVGAYGPDDLAVIRVKGADLPAPAALADSSTVAVGEIVLAVGNPLGLASSVTDGIVSFNGRTVAEDNGAVLLATIQTSAPINPGNSGGALIDLEGKVIGIPTLVAGNAQSGTAAAGIGFAIPSNNVRFIADQLVSSGRVTNTGRAALGIRGANAVLASGEPTGVVVVSTNPGGAADKAGIRTGDLITSVGGHAVVSLAVLADVLAGLKPGATTAVVVDRSGSKVTLRVTLEQLAAG